MSDTNKVVNDLIKAHHLDGLNVMQKRAIRALCYDYEMWLGPREEPEQPTRKRAKVQYYHSPGGQTDIRCLECSGLIRAEYKYCPHCSAELEWP